MPSIQHCLAFLPRVLGSKALLQAETSFFETMADSVFDAAAQRVRCENLIISTFTVTGPDDGSCSITIWCCSLGSREHAQSEKKHINAFNNHHIVASAQNTANPAVGSAAAAGFGVQKGEVFGAVA